MKKSKTRGCLKLELKTPEQVVWVRALFYRSLPTGSRNRLAQKRNQSHL